MKLAGWVYAYSRTKWREDILAIRKPKPNVELDPMKYVKGPVRIAYIDGTAEVLEDQLKRGKSRQWTIICDEPEDLGGFDAAPRPLEYFALGILF